MSKGSRRACNVGLMAGLVFSTSLHSQTFRPSIPKAWDEDALRDWATPVAGLNVRPAHFTAEEYYRAPTDNHRTYPVYAADREPTGYWEMLQKAGPTPLIEPEKL